MFHKDGPTFVELMRQALASTRAGYDMLAPKFDLTPFRTREDLVDAAVMSVKRVDAALDICCGTGVAMKALLKTTSSRLTGIDFSPEMLRAAQKLFTDYDIPAGLEVEFVEADVLEMMFKNEFDLAVMFGAQGHILPRDEPRFLSRVYAALRPGGVFLFVTGGHPPLYSPTAAVFRLFNLIMGIRNRVHKPEFIMYYFTFLLPEIRTKLERAGFEVDVYADIFPEPHRPYRLVLARKP